jgi:hypothetical protein
MDRIEMETSEKTPIPHIPSNPTHPISTRYTKQPLHTHTYAVTSQTNSLFAKPQHCNTLHQNTRAHYFAHPFQVWPPKSGSYLLIVLLMMGILVPETCCNKTAYFVASSRFFTFTISTMHGHMNIKLCVI